jgi:integrase
VYVFRGQNVDTEIIAVDDESGRDAQKADKRKTGSASRPDFKAINRLVRALHKPTSGNKTYSEAELRRRGLTGPWMRGLAARVTAAGASSWVLRYRGDGIQRLYTIGTIQAWPSEKIWAEAAELRRKIDTGVDPRKQRQDEHAAPTVTDLCSVFERDCLPSRRPSTQREYARIIRKHLLPRLGQRKVAAVSREEIAALHREIVGQRHPYQANRVLAVASVLFSLAIERGWRVDHPCSRIAQAPEQPREYFLTSPEIVRLNDVLAATQTIAASAIRLMLLTGCRRNEALAATWAEFDLAAAVWTKPSTNTKQKRASRIPLSGAAVQLLREMLVERERLHQCGVLTPFVFPSIRNPSERMVEVNKAWAVACKSAGLTAVRLHDLRHSFASALVSSGLNLPVIGALLGHARAQTTHRYSHLYDDTLRDAVERVGALTSGPGKGAEVVPLAGGRRAPAPPTQKR